MVIRPATPTDRDRLVELGAKFLQTTEYGQYIGAADAGAIVDGLLEGGVYAIVGEREGVVQGMIAGQLRQSTVDGAVYVDEIAWFVEPHHRTGTLGVRLVEALEAWAKENGAKYLKMVGPSATPSVGAWLERRGYRSIETMFLLTFDDTGRAAE